jgi:3-methyladenine DNA glycosylase AlkD
MMSDVLRKTRKELRDNASEDVRKAAQRFFKESVRVYGVKTASVTAISKKYFKEVMDGDKADIFSLCEGLFRSGYMEESFVACHWSYNLRKRFEEGDFSVFERWLKTFVGNWATCDTFCNHTVGAFIERFPGYVARLKGWAKSDNRWVRRAAAVSLIVPAKRGEYLGDAFEISDILLTDPDDLVRKGYGWLLKEESRVHRREVFDYVMRNRARMPRTSLRYAIELMPQELRAKAMGRR